MDENPAAVHRSTVSKPPPVAPGVLVGLLSTRAAAGRGEQLRHASAAAAWLIEQGLLPPDAEVTEAERRRLLELREDLYALLIDPRRRWTGEAARLFNRRIRDAPLEVSVTSDRTVRIASPDRTFDGALGKIVSLVVHSYFAGQWKRFKECAREECLRVFYDDSRGGARRWCDERCGDKVRTRKHRSAVRHGRR